jgi:hypothetical protein
MHLLCTDLLSVYQTAIQVVFHKNSPLGVAFVLLSLLHWHILSLTFNEYIHHARFTHVKSNGKIFVKRKIKLIAYNFLQAWEIDTWNQSLLVYKLQNCTLNYHERYADPSSTTYFNPSNVYYSLKKETK